MATYIIGDIHGCFQELQQLLDLIRFDPQRDHLGFTGDLVNRGPNSLEVLRFIKGLPSPKVVLGNHDLYLLMIGFGLVDYRGPHTLHAILEAPDKLELLDWLRQQPLVIYFQSFDTILVHAGVPPQWQLTDLIDRSDEIHHQLSGDSFKELLAKAEGDEPLAWDDQVSGLDRFRYIINALTRMRFCRADGTLDLTHKTAHSPEPELLRPWFEWYQQQHQVLFGHWAALEGRSNPRCVALDTGCVWGGKLTAYRLEDGRRFQVDGFRLNSTQ